MAELDQKAYDTDCYVLTNGQYTLITSQGVTLTFCITRPAGLVILVYH